MNLIELQDEFLNEFKDKMILDTIDEAIDFIINKLKEKYKNIEYDKEYMHDFIKLIILLTTSIKPIHV